MTKQEEVQYLKRRRTGILTSFTFKDLEDDYTLKSVINALVEVDSKVRKLNK